MKRYSDEIKKRAEEMAKDGMNAKEIAGALGIRYPTIVCWTSGARKAVRKGKRILGMRSVALLRGLVSRGWAFPKPGDGQCRKVLRKYFDIRKAKAGKTVIYYFPGSERKAMEALLENLGKRSMGYHELGYIRRAFGIKGREAK